MTDMEAIKDTGSAGNRWLIMDGESEVGSLWAPAAVDTPEEALAMWEASQAAEDPLALAKADAMARLRAIRWSKHTRVTYNGKVFVSDDTAATRLVAAIEARQIAQEQGLEAPDATAGWEAADGTMVAMTLDDLRGLLMIGVSRTQACFNRQGVLAPQIAAAPTVEAVLAIDLTTGWPS